MQKKLYPPEPPAGSASAPETPTTEETDDMNQTAAVAAPPDNHESETSNRATAEAEHNTSAAPTAPLPYRAVIIPSLDNPPDADDTTDDSVPLPFDAEAPPIEAARIDDENTPPWQSAYPVLDAINDEPPHNEPWGSEDTTDNLTAWEGEDSTTRLNADSLPVAAPRLLQQGLAAAAMRDIGRVRSENQDCVFSMLTTMPRGTSDTTIGLFVVADGMGGHQCGDLASRLAVRALVHHILTHLVLPTLDDTLDTVMQDLMIDALQAANRAIWEYAQIHAKDMGATCTAALLLGQAIYIAHVGDTRVYLFQNNTMVPITSDHSAVGRLIELGHLDPSASREHPLRNQLYRAIGQQPDVDVDFIYQPLEESSHILLCSDGLWGPVTEKHMVDVLTTTPLPEDACQELITLANLNGGDDNISAVVVALPIED